jgi:hypothetical protein
MLQQKEVKDLIATLQLAKGDGLKNWGRAVFLIGAGCSRSAGIPMADGVAKMCVVKLVKKYSGGKEDIQDSFSGTSLLHAFTQPTHRPERD